MDRKPYTTKEVAKVLGVTSIRVRQLITEGRLKAVKHGTDWMIFQTDLAAYRKALRKAKASTPKHKTKPEKQVTNE